MVFLQNYSEASKKKDETKNTSIALNKLGGLPWRTKWFEAKKKTSRSKKINPRKMSVFQKKMHRKREQLPKLNILYIFLKNLPTKKNTPLLAGKKPTNQNYSKKYLRYIATKKKSLKKTTNKKTLLF